MADPRGYFSFDKPLEPLTYSNQPLERNIFGSEAFKGAQEVFPTKDAMQSPLIKALQQQQSQAGRAAQARAQALLGNRGLAGSTFGAQITGGATAQAMNPYISQIAGTAENLQQQQAQNFMNLLNIAEQRRRAEQQLGLNLDTMEQQRLQFVTQLHEAAKQRKTDEFLGGLGAIWNIIKYMNPAKAATSATADAAQAVGGD